MMMSTSLLPSVWSPVADQPQKSTPDARSFDGGDRKRMSDRETTNDPA
jgi:hypothetical protein